MNLFLLIFGLALLILGAELIIRGSVSFGRKLRVSLFAIGVVIVAGGTSLPELASSINAVVSNHPDLAVGAVIGSNIANLILVMAATSFLIPISKINQNQINQAWINIGLAVILITMSFLIIPFNFIYGILAIGLLFLIMYIQVKQGSLDVSDVEEKGDYFDHFQEKKTVFLDHIEKLTDFHASPSQILLGPRIFGHCCVQTV